jgi:hypothetical protein
MNFPRSIKCAELFFDNLRHYLVLNKDSGRGFNARVTATQPHTMKQPVFWRPGPVIKMAALNRNNVRVTLIQIHTCKQRVYLLVYLNRNNACLKIILTAIYFIWLNNLKSVERKQSFLLSFKTSFLMPVSHDKCLVLCKHAPRQPVVILT